MIMNHISGYIEKLNTVLTKMPFKDVEKIINIILNAYEYEKNIFVMGNGGSGATASHFACDINKGVCSDLEKRFKMMCLNDNMPTMLAYSNDFCYEDVFIEQLKNFVKKEDIVIGISASGNSKNVFKAVKYAKGIGARTIGLVGFDGGLLSTVVDVPVIINSDDIQKIEDCHLIITHMIMQILYKELHQNESRGLNNTLNLKAQ